MNVREALREGERLLGTAGSDEAELEAELLLRHAMGIDRVHLYQRLTGALPPEPYAVYRMLLDRRLAHEPTAYILGRREFFGLEFEVTPAALIPRPETEMLVELVITFARERFSDGRFSLADIGVGCGAIAVAIAHEAPGAGIVAVDVSKRALALARRNARRHGVEERIRFLHGDLLAPLQTPVDVIAANLPYVRASDWRATPPEIREHEPRRALEGGADGLKLIRRLIAEAPVCLKPGGALFAEIGDEQGAAALALARHAFPHARVEVKQDLAGLDRVLAVYTPASALRDSKVPLTPP